MKRTDAEIQLAVLRELKWDTRVDETEIGVQVQGGIVTLTGNVRSWAKRIAAQEAAHRVADVLDVANDISVLPIGSFGRTDAEIASAVRHALEWDVLVPAALIRSTVSEGWVLLEGDVDYWSQRRDAERAIRNLAGVRGITNRIDVRSKIIAEDVRRSIEEALERQAERSAERVHVAVHDGTVTVSGDVRSWRERRAVLGAVTGTAGVRGVDDRLRIVPQTG